MKRVLSTLAGLVALAGLVRADVTIRGQVFYWNLERSTWRTVTEKTDPDQTYYELPKDDGTKLLGYLESPEPYPYLPARNMLIQVDFHGFLDVQEVYTDDKGLFSVTVRNPKVGSITDREPHYQADLCIRATVRLGDEKHDPGKVECGPQLVKVDWKINPEASTKPYGAFVKGRRLEPNTALGMTLYIGGPRQNLREWEHDEEGGRRTLGALVLCQACLEAYDWLIATGTVKPDDISRPVWIVYPHPDDDTCYKSGILGYRVPLARIYFRKGELLPTESAATAMRENANLPTANWSSFRGSMIHEYGHKVMHDVYTSWPGNAKGEHNVSSCDSAELGWAEGWAEFFAAAVLNWPTVNGWRSRSARNIEHLYYPNILDLQDALKGDFAWRSGLEKPDRRYMNEAENSAVLWDIWDPAGWEHMPEAQQDARPAGWPAELQWYERLSDTKLSTLWRLLKKDNPDTLCEVGDLLDQSFVTTWYGRNRRKGDKVHGLKAILYNRDISLHDWKGRALEKFPEHAPEVRIDEVDPASGKATLTVTEKDAEDRSFLYYNAACAFGPGAMSLMSEKDKPLGGRWQGDQLQTTVALPPPGEWDRFLLKVHDSMECAFARYGSDGGAGSLLSAKKSPIAHISGHGAGRALLVADDGSTWFTGRVQGSAGKRQVVPVPRRLESVPAAVMAAVSRQGQNFVLDESGALWTWGTLKIPHGPIAHRSVTDIGVRSQPVRLSGLKGVVAIDASSTDLVALRADGTVWLFHRTSGPKGDGSGKAYSPSGFFPLPGLNGVTDVAAGGSHFLAVAGGKVFAWGRNRFGALGDGSKQDRELPQAVEGPSGVTSIAAGNSFSLALDSDGCVWYWGRGIWEGGRMERIAPTKMENLPRCSGIAAGYRHAVAVTTAGEVWTWGRGTGLGLGESARTTSSPTKVPGIEGVERVFAGGYTTIVRKGDGTLWGWGLSSGLGLKKDDPPENLWTPVRLETLERTLAGSR